jgi:hypothetical protein
MLDLLTRKDYKMNFEEFMDLLLNKNFISDPVKADIVRNTVEGVFELIEGYIKIHGDIALSCGSEWMYQDDRGQVDALELVGRILDSLNIFVAEEE